MKTILFSLLSIFMFASPALASEITQDQGDLGDYMSPAEIAQELAQDSAPKVEFRGTYTNRVVIIVDKAAEGTSPTAQTVRIYKDGRLYYNWYVSTGRETHDHPKSGSDYVSSTPTGNFRIQRMDINHYSKLWEAPMPYAIFFSGGIALHATVSMHIPELGRRASGGCVRLHPVNAQQLWDLVQEVGSRNVLITVHNGY